MKKYLSLALLCALMLTATSCAFPKDEKQPNTPVSYTATDTSDDPLSVPAESADETQTVPQDKYTDEEEIYLDPNWHFADFVQIGDGAAKMYLAKENRSGIIVAINAGHGTVGGKSVKTYCHPDKTPKVTGGTTAEGAIQAVAVSVGMAFNDGAYERDVNLQTAQILRDLLLEKGYDVLMIRDGDDVQLDNVARTVIANNIADCHIALHYDGDSLDYDKGAFYISVPDGIKYLDNVAATWEEDERLGRCLIDALDAAGRPIRGDGSSDIDLTQTSYSEIPTVDIELGNQCTDHSEAALNEICATLAEGVDEYFGR